MSGPKIDHAELKRRQKEALERARLERLNRIKAATASFHGAIKEVSAIADAVRNDRIDIIAQVKENREMSVTIQNIDAIKSEYISVITNLKNTSIPVEPEDIFACVRNINDKMSSYKYEYESKVSSEYARINAFKETEVRLKGLENFSASMSGSHEKKIINFVDFSFNPEILAKTGGISSGSKTAVRQTLEELSDLVNSDWISPKDKRETMALAKKIIAGTRKNEESVIRAINEFNMAKPGISRRIDEFDDLYNEYTAEYVLYLGEVNKMRRNKLSVNPKGKNKFTNIEKLSKEIDMVRKCSQKANEDNYIREQLGEVMQLFGYNLCEDVVFNPEQTGNHYVCPDNKGKNAIHVHISESKQIMMEIVGIENRKAPNETKVSAIIESITGSNEAAAKRMLDEQGKFCEIHPKITEELSKRGINLTAKAHRPQDLKYCKKIINLVSDDSVCSAITDEDDLINTGYAERRLVRKKLERAIKQ